MAVAALVALPAAVLAGLCIGRACDRSVPVRGRVPFCSLPPETRSLIANGFRDGRSPHVLAVTGDTAIVDGSEADAVRWPSTADAPLPGVPLVFAGTGVAAGAEVADGTVLDTVAPTLAEIIGLRRPHPGVRSGEPITGVASGDRPRLIVLVAWKDISGRDLERRPESWPVLRGLMEDGASTMEATAGSLPTDPAAILATIGTGALPRDHGITGSLVRGDKGEIAGPWTEDAPFSVVAALGDDLEELMADAPRIGVVGTDISDRGLIGGNWYNFQGDEDDDDVIIETAPIAHAAAVSALLGSGYGADDTTDLLAVTLDGSVARMDEALGQILTRAKDASVGSFVMAVTSTGSFTGNVGVDILDVEAEVESSLGADVIEATAPGGAFLDQDAMADTGLSDDRVVTAFRDVRGASGERLFADVFPAIAVTFARYC
jgi:hypothetical protein